jgi:Ca2+-binding RTX toxin-like protein
LYYVDNSADKILDATHSGGGYDIVISTATYTLDTHLEQLTLSGNASIHATGNAQNNSLLGNANNNRLDGAAGNDYLIGGVGSDSLTGGLGADTLEGGEGNDHFYFGVSSGNDTIMGFDGAGASIGDQIHLVGLTGFTSFTQVQAATTYDVANRMAVINLGSGNKITLVGIDQALANNDVLFT